MLAHQVLKSKKRFDQIELSAKLLVLDYYLWSNESNINQSLVVYVRGVFVLFFLIGTVALCRVCSTGLR